MTEHGCPQLEVAVCTEFLSKLIGVHDPFGQHDDGMLLAQFTGPAQAIGNGLHVEFVFRNNNILSTTGYTSPQGDVTGTTAHDLNHEGPLMAGRSVAQASMASTTVFTDVSKPIVKSVYGMSLSMVPGRPIAL